jgi:large subunit ribosomal protein L22
LDRLYVKRAVANEGPRMKRVRPAPMGRAFRFQRRMAHIEILLAERGRGSAPPAPATAAAGKAGKK